MNKPRISIIMVDGSFRESFHSIDFFGNQTLPATEYELLWVEYHDRVKSHLKSKVAQFPNMRIIKLGGDGVYHSSFCFNAGIKASAGELLFIPDADVVVERDFLERVWEEHAKNQRLVMYIYRFNEPEEKHVPYIEIEHLRKVCVLTNPANYGGCVSIRKVWLMEINGYEQHPLFGTGYHANGLDLYTRLRNLGLHVMWHPKLRLYHPWHPLTAMDDTLYRLQRIVIDYRSKNLMTNPFNGIDSTGNSIIPEELEAKIDREKRRLAGQQKGLLRRLSLRTATFLNASRKT